MSTLDTHSEDIYYGWNGGPSTRGTMDILWSCLTTIFLCVWTVQHPHVPRHVNGEKYAIFDPTMGVFEAPQKGTTWGPILYRLKCSIFAVLAPEVLFSCAVTDLMSACITRGQVPAIQSLTQAFYLDMGGLALAFEGGDRIPLNAASLSTLVTEGFLPEQLEWLTDKEIQDKSKSATLTKAFTVLQGGYFAANLMARANQGLYITTLEIATAAYVFCFLCTYSAWWMKPQDVDEPMLIRAKGASQHVIKAHSTDARSHPIDLRDFSKDDLLIRSKEWVVQTTRLPKILQLLVRHTKLMNKSVWVAFIVRTKAWLGFSTTGLMVVLFGSLHCAAWNAYFPSTTEQNLWRIASVITASSAVVSGMIAGILLGMFMLIASLPWICGCISHVDKEEKQVLRTALQIQKHTWMQRFGACANVMCGLVVMLYIGVRLFILTEAFAGLRALPLGAFEVVQWTTYIPHV